MSKGKIPVSSVLLPRELYQEFKELARLKGKPASHYIAELMVREMRRNGDKIVSFENLRRTV